MKLTQHSLHKAIGLPYELDTDHTYVYCTGFGTVKKYWWVDRAGNYFLYTNTPEDHEDYNPHLGEPLISPNQPLPQTDPEYYTEDGFKRNQAVDQGLIPERNSAYNPKDPRNVWFEVVHANGVTRYVYKDSDLRENLDLWVQYQLRIADACMLGYRRAAYDMFRADHVRDKVTGCILMLIEQAQYLPEELCDALVRDVVFTEDTIKLLGRKIICDMPLHDFFTSITGGRDPDEPLFQIDTVQGSISVGYNYLYATLETLNANAHYLLCWHASHIYSKIMHRMSAFGVPYEEAETQTLMELADALSLRDNPTILVDAKIRETLKNNYGAGGEEPGAPEDTQKSFSRTEHDNYGVRQVHSDLVERKTDELEFSVWLHTEPMHVVSPELEEEIQAAMATVAAEQVQAAPEEGAKPEVPQDQGAEKGVADSAP